MPPRVRRTSATVRRRPRRRFEWADAQGDLAAIAIGSFSSVDCLATYAALPGASTAGATIVRVHARLWPTGTVTNGDGIDWAFIVDNNNEVATNLAIVTARALNPTEQPLAPWMMYQKFNAHPTHSFTAANNNLEMDIRAKRKLPELQQTLLMVVSNIDASTTQPFSYHVRTLLAMP